MELNHFRILKRNTYIHAGDNSVTCRAVRIRRTNPVCASITACRDNDCFRRYSQNISAAHIHSDNTVEIITIHTDFQHDAFRNKINSVIQALLKERMNHGMTCTVLKVRSSCVRMTAHLTLMEAAILLTVIWEAHIVHLINILSCIFSEVFYSILVTKIVSTFNGIEHVRLNTVFLVSYLSDTVHTTLCHRRSRARRLKLCHYCYLQPLVLGCSKCRTHSCAAASDYKNVISNVALLYLLRNILSVP